MQRNLTVFAVILLCFVLFACNQGAQDVETQAETVQTVVEEDTASEAPETGEPESQATTENLVTDAPETEAPATEPSVTEPPVTQAPVTQAPVTQAPATEPPVTESVTMELPPYEVFEVPELEFVADLSEYEQYMNPQGEKRDDYIFLVNMDNPLSQSFKPKEAVDVPSVRYAPGSVQLDKIAAMALEALLLEADALGHINNSADYPMSPVSGYRNYWTQYYTYENKVEYWINMGYSRKQAEIEAAKTIMPAGCSEHQTGLAIDMHNQKSTDSRYPEAFGDSPEGKWARENCWKFGFILRYPEDKVDVTGVKYESWHFRYVGRYHAYQMHVLDLCLEEYTAYLAQNAA